MVRVSAVLTSTGRSFHHRGARTYRSCDLEVEVRRGGGTKVEQRSGRRVGSNDRQDRQPVEGSEQGGDMGLSGKVEDETSWCIPDELEESDCRSRRPAKRVAVVQVGQNLGPGAGSIRG